MSDECLPQWHCFCCRKVACLHHIGSHSGLLHLTVGQENMLTMCIITRFDFPICLQVILLLAAPCLTWNFAWGLAACLIKAWRGLTAIIFNSVKTLVSIVLRPCSFLATCRLQAGPGRVSGITNLGFWIMSRLPGAADGPKPNKEQLQEAQAALHQTTVVLEQMNQTHVQLVAELQVRFLDSQAGPCYWVKMNAAAACSCWSSMASDAALAWRCLQG